MIYSFVQHLSAHSRQLLQGRIAKAAATSLLLRIFNICLGLITTITLARALGASGFGLYSLGFACATLINGFYQAALNTHIIQTTASAVANRHWETLNGVRRFSIFSAAFISGAVYIMIAIFIALRQDIITDPMARAALMGAAVALPLMFDATASALLQGLSKFARAFIPQFVIMQLVFLLLVLTALAGETLTPFTALLCFGVSYSLAAIISWVFVLTCWPADSRHAPAATPTKLWAKKAVNILVSDLPSIVFGRVEVMLLSLFFGPASAGLYALAYRFSQFTTLPAFAIGSGLAPTVSRLAAHNNWDTALKRIRTATRYTTTLACAGAVFLTLVCWYLFPLVDPAYRAAAPLVGILSLGYIFQSAAGRPLLLLVIRNRMRPAAIAGIISVVFGGMFAIAGIALAGPVGAAVATTLSHAGGILILCFLLWHDCKLRSDIFARLAT